MDPGLAVAFVLGVALALPVTTASVLLVALWTRRPRPVAVAALLGVAAVDAVLATVGVTLGSAIGQAVGDGDLRRTVATGLLVGVGGWIAFRLLSGPYGVAGNAVLPGTPAGSFARFAAVVLFDPVALFAAAAIGVARPAGGPVAPGPIVMAAFVAGGLTWRLLWIATAGRRAGARSARWAQLGLGIAAIVVLALVALRIGP